MEIETFSLDDGEEVLSYVGDDVSEIRNAIWNGIRHVSRSREIVDAFVF
jgi:hypothetical protein